MKLTHIQQLVVLNQFVARYESSAILIEPRRHCLLYANNQTHRIFQQMLNIYTPPVFNGPVGVNASKFHNGS